VNITTGKIASQEVQESLGNIPEKGRSAFETFVNERLGDGHIKRFWDPLGMIIVLSFSDMKKGLSNDKDKKLILGAEVLFRRLLAVSRSRKVDLKMVLTYELVVGPPSLFKDDSSMRKTAEADLQKKLEENSKSLLELPVLPQTASDQPMSAYIIDGMEMLQSLDENQFRTFDDLAVVVQKKLVQILKNASLDVTSVTVVFDRYDVETSVKGSER